MGAKRTHTFYDAVNNKWTVELHDSAYSDPATDMKLEYPGFELSYKGEGDERFEPVKQSECCVYFMVESPTDLALINTIFASGEERYGIVIRKAVYLSDDPDTWGDALIYWAGFILTDLISLEDAPYPFTVELTATDCFGRLSDIPFFNTGVTPYSSDITFTDLLKEIFEKLGTGVYWRGTYPPYLTAVNWYDNAHPSPAADEDPLTLSRVDALFTLETRTDDNGYVQVILDDDGNAKPYDTLRVLSEVCRVWGARCYLNDGVIWFTQVNECDSETMAYRVYNDGTESTPYITTGNSYAYDTLDTRMDIDQSSVAKLATGTDTFKQALLKATAVRKHNSGYNILGTDAILDWDENLTNLNVGFVTGAAGNYLEISGSLKYLFTNNTAYQHHFIGVAIEVALDTSGTDYYLAGSSISLTQSTNYNMTYNNPYWDTSSNSYYFWKPTVCDWIGIPNHPVTEYIPFQLTTPDIPDDAEVTISITLIIDPQNYLNFGGLPDAYTWKFSELRALYIVGNYSNGTLVYIVNTTNGTDPVDDTTVYDFGDMLLGDAVTTQSIGGIEVSDGGTPPTWTYSTDWSVAQTGDTYSITELLCREFLAGQKIPKRIMQASVYGDVNIWNSLVYSSKVYTLNGGTLIAAEATINGEWFESDRDKTNLIVGFNGEIVDDNNFHTEDPPGSVSFLHSHSGTVIAGQTISRISSITPITEPIDVGDVLSDVDIAAIGYDGIINDGDILYLYEPRTGSFQQITVDGDVGSADTNISFDEITSDYQFQPGSYLIKSATETIHDINDSIYWTRTGTELTPKTAGDNVEVTSNASQGAIKGISTDYYGLIGTTNNATNAAIYGSNPSGYAVYGFNNVSLKAAVVGGNLDATGIGVQGDSFFYGVYGTTTNGSAVRGAASGTGYGGYFTTIAASTPALFTQVNPSSTNTSVSMCDITRGTSDTADNNIGGYINMKVETSTGALQPCVQIHSIFTDATNASRTSQLEFFVVDNASSPTKKMQLTGAGALQLHAYGDGTFTGTATTTLNADTDGNVIESTFAEYPTLKVGDVSGGNYTEIEADGTIKLNGTATVFRDEMGELITKRITTPGSNITQNDAEGSIVFDDACDLSDYVTMNVQLNHDRKIGAVVYPHIHWWQASSDIPNWLIQYRWQTNGAAKVTSWTNLPYDSHVFTYTSGTLNQITDFGGITPSSDSISDILQLRLLRDTANASTEFAGADPLTGSVHAVNMDVHIEIDIVGSRTEYSK